MPEASTLEASGAQDHKIAGPELVCPCDARAVLREVDSQLECPDCGARYHRENGCWDLIRGERFHDEKCECMWCNEESTGRHLSENYVIPLLRKEHPGRDPKTVRILSIGCGVGADVEALNEAGFEAYGIDAGNRSEYWARRKFPERYFLANAEHLPFQTDSFDVILMGCVLPHIGVGDDTYTAQPGHEEKRARAASEMVRMTREGGRMIITSPNRHCPVDFFHRADVTSHMPRFHSPSEQFLLSVDDYARLLGVGRECKSIDVLPLRGYWGFYSSSTYLLGRILQLPVRFYFNCLLTWKATSWLRRSPLNPWLILLVQR